MLIMKDYVDELFSSPQSSRRCHQSRKRPSPVYELFTVLDEVYHFAEPVVKKGKFNKKAANAEVVDEPAKDPPHLVETPKTTEGIHWTLQEDSFERESLPL